MKVSATRAAFRGIAAGKHPRSLIYGPDLGREERAEIATGRSGDLGDPFNVVEFTPGLCAMNLLV